MPTDKRLYPLATCSIGIWSTPDRTKSYLLLLPEEELFVILLTREHEVQDQQDENALSVNGLLCRCRNQTSLWLRHKNPFLDHTQHPEKDRSVLAFEISWSNVVGMDFKWPLTQDARLVLEASLVAKRVFDNVESVCLHYKPPARSSRGRRPSTLQQLAEHHANAGITVSTSSSTAAAAVTGLSSGTASAAWQAEAAAAGLASGAVNKLHVAVAAQEGSKQLGVHAGNSNMSRVSSWASWTSWTSGRSSMERTPTALEAAASEPAATVAASTAVERQHQEQGCKQQQQQQHEKLPPCDCKSDASASQAAAGHPHQLQGGAECSIGSQISALGCALHSAPTLEAGMAPGSLLASALNSAAHSLSDSKCSDREITPAPCQELKFAIATGASSENRAYGLAPGTTVSMTSAAAAPSHCSEPVLWSGDCKQPTGAVDAAQNDTADSNLAAAVMPDAPIHVSAVVNAPDNTTSAFSCENSGASFGFWARPLRPLRLLQDNSPAVYATAPCSLPGSPKAFSEGQEGLLLQQQIQQPLLQLYQQQHQEAQDMRVSRQPVMTIGKSSRVSSSRSSRLHAAAAGRSCPLCNQPLLQPLNVLQQRFHEKQQRAEKHRAFPSVKGSATGKVSSTVGKSACSLDQLLEQEVSAGSSNNSGHQQQLQAQVQQQQQQQPGSAKSSAGTAAAAVGALAARCVAAASASSTKDGNARSPGMMSPKVAAAKSGGSAGVAGTLGGAAAAAAAPQGLEVHADKRAQCNIGVTAGDTSCAQGALASSTVGRHDPATVLASGSSAVTAQLSSSAFEGIKPNQGGPAAGAVAEAAAEAVTEAANVHTGSFAPGATGGAADGCSTAATDGHCMYSCRTIVMTFRDPTLPHQLKKVVNKNVRMLKRYESGLPAWAVFMPSYGLWYRPWLRQVTWMLSVLLSVVSMAMGFYDLYKNVPYFKQAIIAMFSPAASVFEWLEHHTQIRLSILLTYMLGKSQIFVQLIKLLTQASLQPIVEPIAAILKPLGAAMSAAADTLAYLAQPFVALGRLVLLLLQLLWQVVSLLLWSGPVQLLTAAAEGLLLLLQLFLFPLQAVLPGTASIRAGWTAAKAAVPVVKGAAATASHAAKSTPAVWGWWWSPLEPLQLMRVSTMRIVKSLQAVVRFFVAMLGTLNQHRLSLMLQLRQQLRGGLRAAAESPAGRVASAVAVKMGQEHRVARLQERLQRADSALVSVGSDLLPADSAALNPALTLDGELSLGLVEALGRHGDLGAGFPRNSQADGDSDDEVTSGVTLAPISPAQASPVQLYSNGTGLRYRGGTAVGSSNRPRSYSRLTAGNGISDAVQQWSSQEAMQWQQQQQQVQGVEVESGGGSSSNKQVTFATALAEQMPCVAQHHQAAVSAIASRRSLDAGMVGAEGWWGVHVHAYTDAEQELLLRAEECRTPRSRLASRSDSKMRVHTSAERVHAACAAANSTVPGDMSLPAVHSPELGPLTYNCDVTSGFLVGMLVRHQSGAPGTACVTAGEAAGVGSAVHAGHVRRSSWG